MPNSGADQRRDRQEEEGEAGCSVAAGQVLDPHAEHDQHQRVAHHAREQAGEQQPEAGLPEGGLHDAASSAMSAATARPLRGRPVGHDPRHQGHHPGVRRAVRGVLPLLGLGQEQLAELLVRSRAPRRPSATAGSGEPASPRARLRTPGRRVRQRRRAASGPPARARHRAKPTPRPRPRRRRPRTATRRPPSTDGDARAAGRLADETVLGELAQVPGHVRRRLLQLDGRLAGRLRAVDDQQLQDVQADRVGQRLHVVCGGDPALGDRHGLKVSFERFLQ